MRGVKKTDRLCVAESLKVFVCNIRMMFFSINLIYYLAVFMDAEIKNNIFDSLINGIFVWEIIKQLFQLVIYIQTIISKFDKQIKQHANTISHMNDFDAFCKQLIKLWVIPAMIFKSQLILWNLLPWGASDIFLACTVIFTNNTKVVIPFASSPMLNPE